MHCENQHWQRAGLWLITAWILANGAGQLGASESSIDHPPLEAISTAGVVEIAVYPQRIDLHSSRSVVRVIVSGIDAQGGHRDLSRVAKLTPRNPDVAVAGVTPSGAGLVRPVAEGDTEFDVTVGDFHAVVPVHVAPMEAEQRVSFMFETLPALTKHGCNSGSCHGTPSGKGGFRLSLEAYDPDADKLTLIREALGRRTNANDPEQSLLLRKPTMEVAHGGGRRLHRDVPGYAVLKEWIAQGSPVDPADAPECIKVEVLPGEQRLLNWPAHTQQLLVLAHFSDGSTRDVTDLTKLTSSDPAIAIVKPDGLVVGLKRGDVAIMARFEEHLETCLLTMVRPVPEFVWNSPAETNYIDSLVYKKLQQMQIQAAEVCTDNEFVRRVHLDVTGVPPTLDQAQAFLEDADPQRRQRLIDELLDSPQYASFWAQKWADLLRVRTKTLSAEGVFKFNDWLVDVFQHNMPMDEFVRQLLTAQGSTFHHPAANYYRAHADAESATEATAQLFLGVRMECAKCHNHPYERWTQDNYYGLSAFFQRVKSKPGSRNGETVVWVARRGDVVQPRTKEVMKPWLPLKGVVENENEFDLRPVLSQWLTSDDNPFFAKVSVNRIWAHVMGRGIVEPVDDFRDSNPPANGELLDALAADFIKTGYDQKEILRRILNSRVYQHSSQSNAFNADDNHYFSHAKVNQLSAEQLADSIGQLTGVWDSYSRLPPGTRAGQLPSPDFANDFLKLFGQPDRETTCVCERSDDSNLGQALQLFNGGAVHSKLQSASNRFRVALTAKADDATVLRDLYLAAYARYPEANEKATAFAYLDAQPDRLQGWEDICWSIINSKEFLFRH
ncbi:Bacterial Ig-like domain (group 2) [Novipirellula galeiformis]|uniref:Bacterial Ig-like domain (Group 2) n=1 Tax=Novipirellula galeiformis TaxID=2528004 RepID=A0A5C6C0Y3_9BACT|nr:DUF1549 domain-containing protein [Novipirellula galeiformis]TWU17291.1 Bacterial Ig-like domain (group 2) [Novipirellula galeiformis]